uniref:E3 ubiquitin-protein ligase TRIM39-like n=1 Tax=Geotrypetes seraphini TaxID=260995 RepID=A0A6P8NNY0_GEOSA|nr:E3 ubiquitin-protein ligase TRIM39-like [Geotrypetes seraphini]XP_033772344.1 E3 ubiquitin-protein ligase TRIM39-like [Geotrypetes seraphini]
MEDGEFKLPFSSQENVSAEGPQLSPNMPEENELKRQLRSLRTKLQDLLKSKSEEEERADKLRSETQKFESEFEELQQCLTKQKEIILLILEKEKNKILQTVTQIEEKYWSLRQQISEIKKKLEKSQEPEQKKQKLDAELHKESPDVLQRNPQHNKPNPSSVGFDWWQECQRYTVDVTLDPETAHPNLVLSGDRKSVRWGGRRQNLLGKSQRFDTYCCVLGCKGFISKRHYWEVEVGNKPGWILGVCKDSVSKEGEISPSPLRGYWTVGLLYNNEYVAFTDSKTQLLLSEGLQAVGILLDYEEGTISFYNADNKSHFFTFLGPFSARLQPFFCLYYYQSTLRIRQIPV